MNWKQLSESGRVQPHTTGRHELDSLRKVIDRDLADAQIVELSADRRFATAYNAALQSAKMVIACSGFRVAGPSHHETTFMALRLAMGETINDFAHYIDSCRRKRNFVDYDDADIVPEGEAEDILKRTQDFRERVELWIRDRYPDLTR